MKWTLAVLAALAAAAFLAPAQWGAAPVAAATATPAALQYDEVTRPVLPPNTPPPPGTFAADYQAASTAQMPKSHGFNPFTAMHDAQEMMKAASAGRATRYTFYNGWIRRDDINDQTATIEKCDRHQYIKLDLAKRTYSTMTEAPPCPTPPQYPGAPPAQDNGGGSGTIDVAVNVTTTNLGPMTIEGVDTNGVERAVELKMSNATGSCRGNMNGADFTMNAREYVSQVTVPRRFCPLPQSTSLTDMFTRYGMGNGCKPMFQSTQGGEAGAFLGLESGKTLVLYSSSTLGVPNAPKQMGGLGMTVERGNVKWLSGSDAQALFEVPAGFTQQG
jgi:hypothetical protein